MRTALEGLFAWSNSIFCIKIVKKGEKKTKETKYLLSLHGFCRIKYHRYITVGQYNKGHVQEHVKIQFLFLCLNPLVRRIPSLADSSRRAKLGEIHTL